jgi:deoxyribodipyrimidine photo-lyase
MARLSMAYRQQAKQSMVWFKQDLRLDDHASLTKAIEQSKGRVIPIYILDPRKLENHALGWPKIGAYRAKFLVEALNDLKNRLKRIGSDLVIRQGKAEEIIPEMAKKYEVETVFTQLLVQEEDLLINDNVRLGLNKLGIEFVELWNQGLYHPEDMDFDLNAPPTDFHQLRKILEVNPPRFPLDAPTKLLPLPIGLNPDHPPQLSDFKLSPFQSDQKSVLSFVGGESQGLARLKSYIWDRKKLSTYHSHYLSLGGEAHSTKFSAWLSMGCLSARRIWCEARAYEQVHGHSLGVYQLIYGLMMRDFFFFHAQSNPLYFFSSVGVKNKARQAREDFELFSKWTAGQTGYPMVDAFMLELMTTGYISQQGRRVVSSFLIDDLQLPWMWGALCFETILIDFDPSITYGLFQSLALQDLTVTKMDIHPVSTALSMDEAGEYVIKWLEFLEKLPGPYRYQPFLIDRNTLIEMGIDIPEIYSMPIVPLKEIPIFSLTAQQRQAYLLDRIQKK